MWYIFHTTTRHMFRLFHMLKVLHKCETNFSTIQTVVYFLQIRGNVFVFFSYMLCVSYNSEKSFSIFQYVLYFIQPRDKYFGFTYLVQGRKYSVIICSACVFLSDDMSVRRVNVFLFAVNTQLNPLVLFCFVLSFHFWRAGALFLFPSSSFLYCRQLAW